MLSTLFKHIQYMLFCALVLPLPAHAMEVTSLSDSGAQLIDSGSTPPIGDSNFNATVIENPHPNWIFQGLVTAETWDKYGKRPSAFAKTGTQPFDPASMAMLSAPTSTKTPVKRSASSATRKTASTTITMPKGNSPYSGAASTTGTLPNRATTDASKADTGPTTSTTAGTSGTTAGAGSTATNNITVPNTATAPSSGVTHTRAPSGTQTNNELSPNAIPNDVPKSGAVSNARPTTGATVTGAFTPAPAPVVAQSTPATPAPAPAPNRPGNIAPKIVLPPNNGTGALVSPRQNI